MKPSRVLGEKFTDTHKNRFAFHRAANQKILHAQQCNHIIGLLLINLDNFQSINNHLGHSIGDKLLLKIQERLISCLSADDFVTRINGDEFAIILGKIAKSKETAKTVRQLMNCFNETYKLEGTDIRINASMGIAFYPEAGIDAQTLLQSATISMSHAKSLGGNNYQYHTHKLNKEYKKKSYLENALKFALEKEELFLMYQPIFNLSTNKMVGLEALLRWRHVKDGLISPTIFIELAEKNGLISAIGEWALQTLCKQAEKWYNVSDHPFKISFNISSNQLLQKSFPKVMMRLFKKSNMPLHLLDLELTETAFVTHASYFETILKKISAAGVNITIDDFGTGHSSLTRLKNLPIRTLKIDKSFVSNITPNSFDAIIIHSLIRLGKKLGLNVIAEGIATKADLQFLIANGCPQGQGYYLCKPLSAKQMTAFLKKNKK